MSGAPQTPPVADPAQERLESVANAPAVVTGSKLDIRYISGQVDRYVNNQARQHDDFNLHLHLFGPPRAAELAKGLHAADIVPTDTPVPQMLKHLRDLYEERPWDEIDDPAKKCACRNQILKMMSEIALHMEARHDKWFDKRMEIVQEARANREHEDRMRVAEKTGDQSLSDEELLARAAELRAKRAKQVPDGDE